MAGYAKTYMAEKSHSWHSMFPLNIAYISASAKQFFLPKKMAPANGPNKKHNLKASSILSHFEPLYRRLAAPAPSPYSTIILHIPNSYRCCSGGNTFRHRHRRNASSKPIFLKWAYLQFFFSWHMRVLYFNTGLLVLGLHPPPSHFSLITILTTMCASTINTMTEFTRASILRGPLLSPGQSPSSHYINSSRASTLGTREGEQHDLLRQKIIKMENKRNQTKKRQKYFSSRR